MSANANATQKSHNDKAQSTAAAAADATSTDNNRSKKSYSQQNQQRNHQYHHHNSNYDDDYHDDHHSNGYRRPNNTNSRQSNNNRAKTKQSSKTNNDEDGSGGGAEQMKESAKELADARISRRRKQYSISSNSTSINCICCLHELYTFAYYSCMHFVCMNCAIKMRVLCEKVDCPVCRQESKQVFCTKNKLENVNIDEFIRTRSFRVPKEDKNADGIFFEDEASYTEFKDMLESKCDLCPTTGPQRNFKDFDEMESHIRKVHRRFYCELCLENLKLFPYERKHYSREELAMHKRNGDKDDYSFKGHPLCEYCDSRFFDRDELYRHYRKEHYYCHFCDTDGHEEYYANYAELRQHFLKTHFLCELDDCSKNGAQTHEYVVFRTELDFQAHKKQKHAKTKLESKNFGKLNIEFNIRESEDNMHRYRRGGGQNSGGGYGRGRVKHHQQQHETNGHSDDDQQADVNRQQSKLKTAEPIDPQVLRMSREQFQREEDERVRNARKEREKEELERIKNEASQSSTLTATNDVVQASVDQPSSSTWRNVISGNSNSNSGLRMQEFPSLSTLKDDKPSEGFSSLASFGESIIGLSTKSKGKQPENNVWAKPAAKEANKSPVEKKQKETPKQNEVKKQNETNKQNETTSTKQNNKKNKKKSNQSSMINEIDENESLKNKISPITATSPPNQKTETVNAQPQQISKPIAEPPPGFSSIEPTLIAKLPSTLPPPGFEHRQQAQQQLQETKAQKSDTKSDFIQPERYDARNETLSTNLFQLFGHFNQNEFELFKKASISFRKDNLSANEYMIECQKLLGLPIVSSTTSDVYLSKKHAENRNIFVKFLDLIQEMIVLLPDTKKQNELYDAFTNLYKICSEFNNTTSNTKKTGNGGVWGAVAPNDTSKSWFTIDNNLAKCEFCQQYFFKTEILFHQTQKHPKQLQMQSNQKFSKPSTVKAAEPPLIVEDFPSLSSATTTLSVKQTINKPEEKVKAKQLEDDFPSLASTIVTGAKKSTQTAKGDEAKNKKTNQLEEEFPALMSTLTVSNEHRFSALPTPSLFNNASSHLSLVNKKKHRLQK